MFDEVKLVINKLKIPNYPGNKKQLFEISVNCVSKNLRFKVSESAVLSENDCIETLLNCFQDFSIV